MKLCFLDICDLAFPKPLFGEVPLIGRILYLILTPSMSSFILFETACPNNDVIFLVDVSFLNSLQVDIPMYQQFIDTMVGRMQVSPSGTHVAIVEYADGSEVRLSLSQGTSVQAVMSQSQNIGTGDNQSNRRLQDGLTRVINDILANSRENRAAYPNVVIYITAGYQGGFPFASLDENAVRGSADTIKTTYGSVSRVFLYCEPLKYGVTNTSQDSYPYNR